MIPSPVRIVGSGLLGASLGLRLRQLGARVQLEDTSPASAALARDLGAGDIATADSPAPQLVVVATPPDVSGDVVKASLDRFPEAVVTDVASVKARIVGEVAGHPGAERYAGSHPMAGRERSGAIAAAVKSELPNAQVFAVELSEEAIPYARKNLEPLGVHLVQGDALTALTELAGRFDAVLSNPPYIPPGNVPADPEAALHDPEMALYGGGADGMQMPSAIAARAYELLAPGGFFMMEHDDTQEEAVAELLARVGFERCYPVRDLNGRSRHSAGYKPAAAGS